MINALKNKEIDSKFKVNCTIVSRTSKIAIMFEKTSNNENQLLLMSSTRHINKTNKAKCLCPMVILANSTQNYCYYCYYY